jgi:hypothetical protein
MVSPSARIVETQDLTARPARRDDGPSVLQFSVGGTGDVRHITIVRHASGALTIHPGDRNVERRGSSAATETSFSIPIPGPTGDGLSRIIKIVVLEVPPHWSISLCPGWRRRGSPRRGGNEDCLKAGIA